MRVTWLIDYLYSKGGGLLANLKAIDDVLDRACYLLLEFAPLGLLGKLISLLLPHFLLRGSRVHHGTRETEALKLGWQYSRQVRNVLTWGLIFSVLLLLVLGLLGVLLDKHVLSNWLSALQRWTGTRVTSSPEIRRGSTATFGYLGRGTLPGGRILLAINRVFSLKSGCYLRWWCKCWLLLDSSL